MRRLTGAAPVLGLRNTSFYVDVKRQAPVADYDYAVVWVSALLLALGLVMVYSASIAIAEASSATGRQPYYYLLRHAVFIAIGLAAAAAVFQVPVRIWQRAALGLFLLGLLLLVLVLVPGIGREVNGSRRWISLYVVGFQPSELMKLAVVIYAADYTVRKAAFMHSFRRGFLPMLVVMLATGYLLLSEPDFGAFAVIAVIAMGVLFLGGLNWRLFAGLAAMLVIGFVILILASPYRLQRIMGFMDPWADPYGRGYQLSHALIAFGRGEWFGVGLGASVEKLFYLPEAHTDFLLAVIAEELGFAGVLVIIGLFAWLTARAFAIGRRAATLERYFAALVAQGIGLWIGVQAIINMGVNMGVLPTKGLTLPLLSFGGSAIVTTCCAIGLLLRIDWENRQLMRGLAV
jgi:cell division protein FtsW